MRVTADRQSFARTRIVLNILVDLDDEKEADEEGPNEECLYRSILSGRSQLLLGPSAPSFPLPEYAEEKGKLFFVVELCWISMQL